MVNRTFNNLPVSTKWQCPKDCPDRKADPNCHATCERYRRFMRDNAKRRKAERLQAQASMGHRKGQI